RSSTCKSRLGSAEVVAGAAGPAVTGGGIIVCVSRVMLLSAWPNIRRWGRAGRRGTAGPRLGNSVAETGGPVNNRAPPQSFSVRAGETAGTGDAPARCVARL